DGRGNGGALSSAPRRSTRTPGGGHGLMLTVDFDRVGVTSGSRVLDMGCGGGRHAFEAWRRGASVVALDYSEGELKDVRGVLGAMLAAGEVNDTGGRRGGRKGAA